MLVPISQKVDIVNNIFGDVTQFLKKSPICIDDILMDYHADGSLYFEFSTDNTKKENETTLRDYLGIQEIVFVNEDRDWVYVSEDNLNNMLGEVYNIKNVSTVYSTDDTYVIYNEWEN